MKSEKLNNKEWIFNDPFFGGLTVVADNADRYQGDEESAIQRRRWSQRRRAAVAADEPDRKRWKREEVSEKQVGIKWMMIIFISPTLRQI